LRQSGAGWPSLASWKANAPRGLLSMASTLLFFTALRHLPFAEALSLSYVGPLLVALIAAAVLGERLRLGVIGPILLGLAGVGVIAHDSLARQTGLSTDLVGIAAAIGSAMTYATGNVLLRSLAQREVVMAGVTGIAAPIFDAGDHVLGSLSLTVGRTGLTAAEMAEIATRVAFCAQVVSSAMSAQENGGLWIQSPPHPGAEAMPMRPDDNRLVGAAVLSASPQGKIRRGRRTG
jgi:threonine/homoserine efflux transporter RhtA